MRYHYLFSFARSINVKTNKPLKNIWEYFLQISDLPYLNRKWKEPTHEKRIKVSTHIKQAYEYYNSSQNVSLLTKPVLLYYSLHNLTKAFLELKGVQADLNYHGLCNCTTNEDFLKIHVFTNRGVFSALAGCLGYVFDSKELLSLEDFINNTVEGNQLLSEYFDIPHKYLKIRWDGTFDGFIKLDLLNWKKVVSTQEELNKILLDNTELLEDFVLCNEGEKLFLKSRVKCEKNNFNMLADELAKKYCTETVFCEEPNYIKLIPKSKYFNPALGYYGISFILSSIVRYNPEFVEKYFRTPISSYEFLISKLLELCERILPNLYINIMKDRNVIYQ